MTILKALCYLIVWIWIANVIYQEARKLRMNHKTWTVLWLIFPPSAIIYMFIRFRRLAEVKQGERRYRLPEDDVVAPVQPEFKQINVMRTPSISKKRPCPEYSNFGLQPIQARSTLSQMGIFILVNAAVMATLIVVFPAGALLAPVFGISGALISLLLSKWLAKRAHHIYVIEPQHFRNDYEAWLYNMVADLSQKAGLPGMPEVGVYDSPDMNAFATGARKSSALVAFSSGLLQKSDQEAITGIAAHEIAHIANGDMIMLTMVQAVVNTLIMLITLPLSVLRFVAFFSESVDWVIFLII